MAACAVHKQGRARYRSHLFESFVRAPVVVNSSPPHHCPVVLPLLHVATFARNARCRSPACGRGGGSSQRRGRGAAHAARRHARRCDASRCAAAPA
eukprot:2733519-Prymnesium_polylepis.1